MFWEDWSTTDTFWWVLPTPGGAEVVLDGSGRLVRNHPVQVTGGARRVLSVSCPSLAERYEQFIQDVRIAEEPAGTEWF